MPSDARLVSTRGQAFGYKHAFPLHRLRQPVANMNCQLRYCRRSFSDHTAPATGLLVLVLSLGGCSAERAETTAKPSDETTQRGTTAFLEAETAEATLPRQGTASEASQLPASAGHAFATSPPEAYEMPAASAPPPAAPAPRSSPRYAPAVTATQSQESSAAEARPLAPPDYSAPFAHTSAAPVAPAPGPVADHLQEMPAGATHSPELGYATVSVFYATDRARAPLPLQAYHLSGAKQPVMLFAVLAVGCGLLALLSMFRGRSSVGALATVGTVVCGGFAAGSILLGTANIEKHGVAYNSERGTLSRGICEVTVPDSHQRGQVERPSLLRFEFREDQSKHMVLKSAVELTQDDFQRRLAGLVEDSDERDLLVFIHGYNVDFESAVQRTAQIAVDLPFHGVPVCYSWPSQGTLLGYPIDENNAAWTTSHLRSFLMELVETSGADSINLVAHSMGNRALTAALSEISWQMSGDQTPLFDRVVLAAPDVDADHFQRDLAPRVLQTSRHVTLYASSDDRALIASKQVHGYPRAGESGSQIVVVPGIETIDVSGIDLSLLGHSYYGDNGMLLRDLFQLVHDGLPAGQRSSLLPRPYGALTYWQLATAALAESFAAPPVR